MKWLKECIRSEALKTICVFSFFCVVIYFVLTNPHLKILFDKKFTELTAMDLFWLVFFGTFFGNLFR